MLAICLAYIAYRSNSLYEKLIQQFSCIFRYIQSKAFETVKLRFVGLLNQLEFKPNLYQILFLLPLRRILRGHKLNLELGQLRQEISK